MKKILVLITALLLASPALAQFSSNPGSRPRPGNIPHHTTNGAGTISASYCTDSQGRAVFAVGANCFSVTGAVSSVTNSDGTLTVSPTTGAVVASIALSHANTWAGVQSFTDADFALLGTSTGKTTVRSGLTGSGNNTLVLPTTASDTLAALATAQTWGALQTFTNSDLALLGSSTGKTTFTSANTGASNYTWTWPAISDTVAGLTGVDQTLSGGANLTPYNPSAGNYTVDCGKNPGQWIANTGAFTITAPASDGACDVQIENGSGAGAVTWSGFSEGANTGDALDTTNGHVFIAGITRLHGKSHYLISAFQ
jgi:hypothetical protein